MVGARALDICEVVEMLLGVPRDNGMFAIYCNQLFFMYLFVSGALYRRSYFGWAEGLPACVSHNS